MRKHKPSERQREFDFDYVERNRWVKLRLLEELPVDESIKGVLYALDRCIRDKKWCRISCEKLGLRMGVSSRTVSRRLNDAASEGWIEIKRINGRASRYRIIWSKVFEESIVDIQDEIIAAQVKVESGDDAETALDNAQEEQRSENPKNLKSKRKPHKKDYGNPAIVTCASAGYSPHGPPTDKPKHHPSNSKTLTVGRTTRSRKCKRWNLHLDPHMLRESAEIQKLFENAVKLGMVPDTNRWRQEVWSLAVHCRKAKSPGAMFRTNIEAGDFGTITEANEQKALIEIEEHDKQSEYFSSVLDQVFEGA